MHFLHNNYPNWNTNDECVFINVDRWYCFSYLNTAGLEKKLKWFDTFQYHGMESDCKCKGKKTQNCF